MFHILVVDDQKHTRMLIESILRAEQYTVSTACNGEEALEIMDTVHIDLPTLSSLSVVALN